jgi:hypothetical protein
VLITAEDLEKAGVPEDVREAVLQSVNSKYVCVCRQRDRERTERQREIEAERE